MKWSGSKNVVQVVDQMVVVVVAVAAANSKCASEILISFVNDPCTIISHFSLCAYRKSSLKEGLLLLLHICLNVFFLFST